MKKQQGFSLFIAMIMLIAIAVLAVALVNSMRSTTLAASNVAFKQATLASSDAAVEEGVRWLLTKKPSALWNDDPSAGYYASNFYIDFDGKSGDESSGNDPDWVDGGQITSYALNKDGVGNQVRYIIQRMCNTEGEPPNGNNESKLSCMSCIASRCLAAGDAEVVRQGTIEYGKEHGAAGGYCPKVCKEIYAQSETGAAKEKNSANFMIYKITARTQGPKDTVSYTESLVAVSMADSE